MRPPIRQGPDDYPAPATFWCVGGPQNGERAAYPPHGYVLDETRGGRFYRWGTGLPSVAIPDLGYLPLRGTLRDPYAPAPREKPPGAPCGDDLPPAA